MVGDSLPPPPPQHTRTGYAAFVVEIEDKGVNYTLPARWAIFR